MTVFHKKMVFILGFSNFTDGHGQIEDGSPSANIQVFYAHVVH